MSERGRLLVGGLMVLGLAGLVILAGSSGDGTKPASTTAGSNPVPAAAAALEAWGRFAVNGDLDELAASFHNEGPQYRLLATEAADLAVSPRGDPPYRFDIAVVEVRAGLGTEQVVRAEVTMSRSGESTKSFKWDLVMRPIDEGWVLWTVEEWP